MPLLNHLLDFGRLAVACLLLSVLMPSRTAAGTPPWPEAPYSYFAQNSRLETVLQDFATSFSLHLAIQPGLTGSVNGRFTSASPTEFISRLGGVYGFSWYTQAGTLHVTRSSDHVMRTVPIPAAGMSGVRQALIDLGVVDPRFGWGELPEHGVLMLSGPPAYVSAVESALRRLPAASAGGQEVRVFRLRHASANDRVILYRDRQITQPGLATVLRGLLSSNPVTGVSGTIDEKVSESPAPVAPAPALGASAAAPAAVPPAVAAAPAPGPRQVVATGSGLARTSRATVGIRAPAIQADPRLNAVVISDAPDRLPLYERLIAQLDVPSELIEIEAMIIDINAERAREIGINWSARLGNVGGSFSLPTPAQFGAFTLSGVAGSATFGSATLPVDAGNYLIGQIQLLENKGDARIQSRPSVLTTDNIGALLDLSETFYVRVLGERVASVSPITAGTTLKVTPRLVDGTSGSIQLTVDIEDGQIQDRQVDSLPTVRRSTVSTQATVRQNETLMIAGYSSDQNITNDRKVPWFGDLPVVGALFSSTARTVQKRERVFLIRPKVVTAAPVPAPAPAPSPAPSPEPAR